MNNLMVRRVSYFLAAISLFLPDIRDLLSLHKTFYYGANLYTLVSILILIYLIKTFNGVKKFPDIFIILGLSILWINVLILFKFWFVNSTSVLFKENLIRGICALITPILFVFPNISDVVSYLKNMPNSSKFYKYFSVAAIPSICLLGVSIIMPWSKTEYRAGNADWKFNASGTRYFKTYCCWISEMKWQDKLYFLLPFALICLGLIFIYLGKKIPTSFFFPYILFYLGVIVETFMEYGDVTKSANWTADEISANALSATKSPATGFYLMIIGVIIFAISIAVLRIKEIERAESNE